jgi:methionine-rich copper-binding protein CopC
MLARIRRRLTFANVCSFLALTIALSTGTAYAANTVFSTDIVDGEVKTADIDAHAVRAGKIAEDAVTGAKVLDESLKAADLKGADVKGSSISLGAGAVANGRCKDFDVAIPGAQVGEAVVFSLIDAAPEGMLFYGVRVPTNNHVTLKVCNLSGGTFPEIANLDIRVITFG